VADRIDQWRGFLAVAEARSVTAAARTLGISQSTLSKHLAALERRLGTALVHRTTRSLALSDAGERLVEAARNAVAAADAADAALSQRDPLAGRIRLTAPANLAHARLAPIFADFQRGWPQIGLDARYADARADLARDQIDLAVRVGALGDRRGARIGTARRILVAAPGYLAATGTPATVADLAHHRCLTYALLESGSVWEFTSGESVAVSGPFSANDPTALRLAALAGLGIALSATWMFVDDLADGRLVHVLPHATPRDMPIHLVLRQSTPPPRVSLFAEFLAARVAADPLLQLQP